MERLEYFQKELFKYSKFKVGDKVKLIETPNITEKTNWGWIGYKDYIIKGANVTIQEIDHYGGTFRYMIEFDKCRGQYFSFNENKLKRNNHAIHK